MDKFQEEKSKRIEENKNNHQLIASSHQFMLSSIQSHYSYNFSWLGLPIIQYPQDMVAIQELIWEIKPDLIIETGIARGGSLVLSASMLAMLDYCDAIKTGCTFHPKESKRKVVGIDIDIRSHNRSNIDEHPLRHLIEMIEGSSISSTVIDRIKAFSADYQRILVCLDSNHTHEHVLAELEAYAPLVSYNSYCVVFDGIVDDLPDEISENRPWGVGNNPKTAVHQYLKHHPEFIIDDKIDNKLQITVAPSGYLKRVK
ncbi:cephalosporin hydroxylase [Colwellia sp. M166]|uniref:cephalosporin hydroxylase family protein n=1 Tax=Colwellia sp. M166 TaxID=2583805 RepID=UPI00211E1331|nr:cephalosporin hydroxylase family protein [Colwellia sp. M166]UUO23124.1 cephalosporin hydroxylase [Colwellia sp. M166]|tara:strand:- start:28337 stop:29107 length:771 start_codon:yes stop_codon:yes gene_type:complete